MQPRCDGTVYLVEDDAAVREALTRLLAEIGCRVEAVASAEEFLALDREADPACILLDVRLPGMSGLALQEQLSAIGLPIIFLTGHGDVPMAVDAMKKGALDFLTKPVDEDVLLEAVARALAADRRRRRERRRVESVRGRVATLTPRERQVLRRVISGAPNKRIAADLGIALKTVKIHRGHAMAKMEAGSLAELVELARRAGITPEREAAPAPTAAAEETRPTD